MTSGAEPACSNISYNPEWWVMEHPGRCSVYCPHSVASHICLNHCPLLQQCQEMAALNPDMWAGMVVGGRIWDHRKSRREFVLPPHRERCESCSGTLVTA